MGGLASQMHKYSIGKLIADRYNAELLLDLSWFSSEVDLDTKREFQLNKFCTEYSIASQDVIRQLKSNTFLHKFTFLIRKFGFKNNLLKVTHYVKGIDERDLQKLSAPIYIEGEWFGAKHIESIRHKLLNEFSLKGIHNFSSRFLMNRILTSESVAIHVRRGDFITNPSAARYHYLTGMIFFKEAIDYCIKSLKEPVFFVFSDDPSWVENSFSCLNGNFVFVRNNDPSEDLDLMKNCKHQIICNSVFGWFAAWLNCYEQKIMIAPRLWVTEKKLNDEIVYDLLSSGFHLF